MKLFKRNKQPRVSYCEGCGCACASTQRRESRLDAAKTQALTRTIGRYGL